MKTLKDGTITLRQLRKWCSQAHGAQTYGSHPYSFHLGAVEAVAIRFGFLSRTVRMACWAHDVLEDTTKLAEDMIAVGFPYRVVQIAEAVKDEPGETREEKKLNTYPKIAADRLALIVKLCDRIANVESSRMNSRRKYERYQEEHAAFKAHLLNSNDVKLLPLWQHLEKILEAEAR
ncbi:MAG: hypothetical protein K8F91_12660 [Candidatus Obscuribacterales bacterium]|nr:hypothetical protein [Candidatus Obscuribacterales bacterium]